MTSLKSWSPVLEPDRLSKLAISADVMLAAWLLVYKGSFSVIVPVMLYNAKLANDMARDMYAEGIYVIGFCFPVVPAGKARIRVQLSAAHEKEHLDKCVKAFRKIGDKYGILGLGKNEIIEKYGR